MTASCGVSDSDVDCTGPYNFPRTTTSQASGPFVAVLDSANASACAAENVKSPTTKGEGGPCTRLGDTGWDFKVPSSIGCAVGGVI